MNKVFLFALQLVGVLAPFWRSMQALLWANSGRASEGALWNIVYCGGPLLIACALARWRILKGKETFSPLYRIGLFFLAVRYLGFEGFGAPDDLFKLDVGAEDTDDLVVGMTSLLCA